MNPYSVLEDKELYDKLGKAGLVDRLESTQEWGLLKEAAARIVERAIQALVNTPATNLAAIIELQQVIKKYKYGLFAEINMLRQEGLFVFDELQAREAITTPQSENEDTSGET